MSIESTNLKTVKVLQPQISKATSLRSTSASDDYFSDYATDRSSNTDLPKAQYETPPSKISTPIIQQQHPMESEMTLPARPSAISPADLQLRSSRPENGRKEITDVREIMDRSPPTPGIDDTPYIRFAIEQLTRDEELMGQGRHGSVVSEDYPIQRIIPDEGLGYVGPPGPPSQPPRPPGRSSTPPETLTRRPVRGEILLPVAPPSGTQWADLGYLPGVLRVPFLLLLLLLCILMITGILFSNIYALRNHGLFDYDGTGTARYFVFQFLPQLLGVLLILWLFVLEAAIYRTFPFLAMSSHRSHSGILQHFRIYPANYLYPDFHFFRNGEFLVGFIMVIFWLTNFTVPLLSCFYQTEWITTNGNSRWRWTAVRGVGWTLLVLYVLLAGAITGCLIRFRRSRSALMWDPVSLADLIPLFQRSNVLADFERSEISASMHTHLPLKSVRLGHWTTSKSQEMFYAVGESDAPVQRLSYPTPIRTIEKRTPGDSMDSFDIERHRYSYASSFTRNIHSPFVRYRWVPWFLRDSAVLAWTTIAIILLIAFLVVSFVHQAVQRGFLPLLPSGNQAGAFSPSDFLYSFLPSLLGMFLFLAWQPIDMTFRTLQPFVNLSSTIGALAANSLLLSYPSQLPLHVTLNALINSDFKLAWISFVSILSLTLPVLAGGIFTAQYFHQENQVRIAACMPAYYALCVFAAVYAVSFLVVWPKRKRYLPHSVRTLADLISFLYMSPLLVADPALTSIRTKADLVAGLMFPLRAQGSRVNLVDTGSQSALDAEGRYAFGIYIGLDGKEHLGIDRLHRPGEGEMLITTGGRIKR